MRIRIQLLDTPLGETSPSSLMLVKGRRGGGSPGSRVGAGLTWKEGERQPTTRTLRSRDAAGPGLGTAWKKDREETEVRVFPTEDMQNIRIGFE